MFKMFIEQTKTSQLSIQEIRYGKYVLIRLLFIESGHLLVLYLEVRFLSQFQELVNSIFS